MADRSEILNRARATVDRHADIEGDIARRREELGDAAFETPVQRKAVSGIVTKINENALVRPALEVVDVDYLRDAITKTVLMVAEEVGVAEKNIRADLVRRQDDALRQINERLDAIEARQDDLQNQLDAMEADIADVIDRSGNVRELKRKRNHAA